MANGFSSGQEGELLGRSLERYLRESYSGRHRIDVLKSAEGFSRKHWSFFADLGLLGLPFAESDGGFGGKLADVMGVMRLLGRALVLEPYHACIVLAGGLIARSTDLAVKAAWLGSLIAGERLVGLAHLERGDRGRGEVRFTTLKMYGERLRLDGAKILVPLAQSLDAMLVTARNERGGMCVCLVPAGTPGVEIRSCRTVDGHAVGEVRFDGVTLGLDAKLAIIDAAALLDELFTYADAAFCAEAVGCMESLLEMTVGYAKTRKQFGQPIGTFQAVKHRLVECYGSVEQAIGMLELSAADGHPAWAANVAAARSFIDEHAIRLGHEAIQLHGGMGMTDELAVSHYHKRITMIAMLLGDRSTHMDRYISIGTFASDEPKPRTLAFDTLLSPTEQVFREEVREFLNDNLTEEIRTHVRRQCGTYPEKDIVLAWQRRLNARGWLAAHWPRKFGGSGWTPVQRFLFEYESCLAGGPEQQPMGVRYVGPVIAHFGSQWQKEYFLPKILSGEHYWAQGFSEPGAGSDLAALTTTAILDGDHYIVNGSKMWTTHAHYADWMFCLVRTEKSARPQEGISFLLIDLRSPGVRIERIPLLAHDHEVNQVFLDSVRVPVTYLVGESGRGWEYAKFLLEIERGGSFFCGRMRHEYALARELVDTIAPELWQDRIFVHRLVALDHRLLALEFLELLGARSMQQGSAPGARGSLTKLLGSELQKDITEVAMQIAGYGGAEMIADRPLGGAGSTRLPAFDLEAVAMPRYLNMRVASIYGGSSEIQREILAKHVLGLR